MQRRGPMVLRWLLCGAAFALLPVSGPALALDCEYLALKVRDVETACASGDASACDYRKHYQKSVDQCAAAPEGAITDTAQTVPPPDTKPKPEPDPLALEVQTLLAAAGFDPGPLDGQVGASTCAAANAFATARKKPVGCGDLIALRRELRAAADATDPLAGCDVLAQISDDRFLTAWRDQQAALLALLQDELADLRQVEQQMQGDMNQIGSTRVALSDATLSVRAVAKLSIGIGVVTTFVAAPATAAVLLKSLAVLWAAEKVDAQLRAWSGRAQLDSVQPELRALDSGNARINQGLKGIVAIIEGATGIKSIADRGVQARQAAADLWPLLAQQRARIEATTAKVRDSQGYLAFLDTLGAARDLCAKPPEMPPLR